MRAGLATYRSATDGAACGPKGVMAITAAAQPNAAPTPNAVRNAMVVTNPLPAKPRRLTICRAVRSNAFAGCGGRRNLGHSFRVDTRQHGAGTGDAKSRATRRAGVSSVRYP